MSTDTLVFYADDGRLAGYDARRLQEGLDVLGRLFSRVGL